jgi:HSP20 family protein
MSKKKSFFERLTGSIRMDVEDDAFLEDDEITQDDHTIEDDVMMAPEEGELAVDVYETNDAVILQAMTAGTRKHDLDITITRESITIRGERHSDARVHDDSYLHQELYWGVFSRTIQLPEEVEVEASMAKEEHGLLTIKMPKVDKYKQAKLKVS